MLTLRLAPSRTQQIALAAIAGFGLSLGILILTGAGLIWAQNPWPTPPPGPRPQVPTVIDDADITAVNIPSVPGATSWVVPPFAALLPRTPPVRSTRLDSPDGVSLLVDAGSIISTVQILYEPVPIEGAQPPGPRQELRRVFDLISFDHRAKNLELDLQRPWVLEVSASGLTESIENPARLILARYDDDNGWLPLVTTYHRNRLTLETRIIETGRYAAIFEPLIVSGSTLSKNVLPN